MDFYMSSDQQAGTTAGGTTTSKSEQQHHHKSLTLNNRHRSSNAESVVAPILSPVQQLRVRTPHQCFSLSTPVNDPLMERTLQVIMNRVAEFQAITTHSANRVEPAQVTAGGDWTPSQRLMQHVQKLVAELVTVESHNLHSIDERLVVDLIRQRMFSAPSIMSPQQQRITSHQFTVESPMHNVITVGSQGGKPHESFQHRDDQETSIAEIVAKTSSSKSAGSSRHNENCGDTHISGSGSSSSSSSSKKSSSAGSSRCRNSRGGVPGAGAASVGSHVSMTTKIGSSRSAESVEADNEEELRTHNEDPEMVCSQRKSSDAEVSETEAETVPIHQSGTTEITMAQLQSPFSGHQQQQRQLHMVMDQSSPVMLYPGSPSSHTILPPTNVITMHIPTNCEFGFKSSTLMNGTTPTNHTVVFNQEQQTVSLRPATTEEMMSVQVTKQKHEHLAATVAKQTVGESHQEVTTIGSDSQHDRYDRVSSGHSQQQGMRTESGTFSSQHPPDQHGEEKELMTSHSGSISSQKIQHHISAEIQHEEMAETTSANGMVMVIRSRSPRLSKDNNSITGIPEEAEMQEELGVTGVIAIAAERIHARSGANGSKGSLVSSHSHHSETRPRVDSSKLTNASSHGRLNSEARHEVEAEQLQEQSHHHEVLQATSANMQSSPNAFFEDASVLSTVMPIVSYGWGRFPRPFVNFVLGLPVNFLEEILSLVMALSLSAQNRQGEEGICVDDLATRSNTNPWTISALIEYCSTSPKLTKWIAKLYDALKQTGARTLSANGVVALEKASPSHISPEQKTKVLFLRHADSVSETGTETDVSSHHESHQQQRHDLVWDGTAKSHEQSSGIATAYCVATVAEVDGRVASSSLLHNSRTATTAATTPCVSPREVVYMTSDTNAPAGAGAGGSGSTPLNSMKHNSVVAVLSGSRGSSIAGTSEHQQTIELPPGSQVTSIRPVGSSIVAEIEIGPARIVSSKIISQINYANPINIDAKMVDMATNTTTSDTTNNNMMMMTSMNETHHHHQSPPQQAYITTSHDRSIH